MNTLILSVYVLKRGHAVAQVVDALRYKPEGRGFDSSWCLALGSTQQLTEKSNRNFSWRVKAADA
jgi:hypothetical protein